MILLIIIRIITSLSVTMLTCSNPFSIAINILLIALISSGLYAIIHSTWLSLLIFLIYIGGILVIFSYFLAVAPNQQKFSTHSIIIPAASTITFIFMILIITDSWVSFTPLLRPLTSIIFCSINLPTLIILVLILLFTIIVVIKVCKLEKGPLRSFIRLYV